MPRAQFQHAKSTVWSELVCARDSKTSECLAQVVITSFFVQLLGLFNPLLIQQIIDAVISQGNYSSLNVLGTCWWPWL